MSHTNCVVALIKDYSHVGVVFRLNLYSVQSVSINTVVDSNTRTVPLANVIIGRNQPLHFSQVIYTCHRYSMKVVEYLQANSSCTTSQFTQY